MSFWLRRYTRLLDNLAGRRDEADPVLVELNAHVAALHDEHARMKTALKDIQERALGLLNDPDHNPGNDIDAHDALGVIANIAGFALR